MTRILGIDPGLTRTGWGIIHSKDNRISHIASGMITSDARLPLALRLKQLHDGLAKVFAAYTPDESAVEETFMNMNGASTLKLGQARGAILLALSLAEIPVTGYSANMIKKSVVGSGHADKQQVGMMVKTLLPSSAAESADAADALAVAITHAHHRTITAISAKAYS